MSSSDPSRIVDVLCAYWQTATLTAAIDLGLFSALGSGARTASELARACGADRASLIRLCDSLVSLGLLRRAGGRYRAAADAARFLDAQSPESLVAIRRFFSGPPVTTAFAGLAATVRGGPKVRPPSRGRFGGPGTRASWRGWPAFAASTLALRRRAAKQVAAALVGRGLRGGRVLDVGAGASPLGIELLRRWRTATLVARDRAAVVGAARQHAIAVGVSSRVTTVAGDVMTRDWGGPFDLVLMVNVLDYFDGPAQMRLLRKARRALRPGGALVVAAPLLDAGRRSPPDATAYDLLLLALGSPGRPSTWQERRQQLRRAGFGAVTRNVAAAVVLARTPLR
jgi:SAM-dependent methyltransferase